MKFKVDVRDISWFRDNVPCMEACPVKTDAGKYVQLIAEGHFEEAFQIARSSNPTASMCGRICAAPCEAACRRGKIDQAIAIRPLKRFVTEKYGAEAPHSNSIKDMLQGKEDIGSKRSWHLSQLVQFRDALLSKIKVAVVGGGPAGIACAHDLALRGYHVTIFEATSQLGGMARLGIPEYRLPRDVLAAEITILDELSVEIKLNMPLTDQFGIREIRDLGYEAIFLSIGAAKGRDLKIAGTDHPKVIKALDYLQEVNTGKWVHLGKRVTVIGGGLVALDAARTIVRTGLDEDLAESDIPENIKTTLDVARMAIREGVEEVKIVSLETLEEMPASQTDQGINEIAEARHEGVSFYPGFGPKRILIENNQLKGLEVHEVESVFDKDGKFNPTFRQGTEQVIESDSVILAIGQAVDVSFIKPEDNIRFNPDGTIKIDLESFETTAPGIFSGGDAAFGPRILIEGTSNGKKAAESIHNYLQKNKITSELSVKIKEIPKEYYKNFSEYEKHQRIDPATISVLRRTTTTEVEKVFKESEAREEAQRCLYCHINTIYDSEKCVICNACVDVCPEFCLRLAPVNLLDIDKDQEETVLRNLALDANETATAMIKDDDKCIRCGLCAIVCPTDAMTMETFEFEEKEISAGGKDSGINHD